MNERMVAGWMGWKVRWAFGYWGWKGLLVWNRWLRIQGNGSEDQEKPGFLMVKGLQEMRT